MFKIDKSKGNTNIKTTIFNIDTVNNFQYLYCEQYQYVSSDNLSSLYCTFVSKLSSVDIPMSIWKALKVLEWKKDVHEEMEALEKNGMWEMAQLFERKLIIGCKWVFTVRFHSNGSLERYKARLVAKGFSKLMELAIMRHMLPSLNQIQFRYYSLQL